MVVERIETQRGRAAGPSAHPRLRGCAGESAPQGEDRTSQGGQLMFSAFPGGPATHGARRRDGCMLAGIRP
jgi:hypothetical protein